MDVTITRILEAYAEAAIRITPGSDHTDRGFGDSRQRIDLAHRFLVKIGNLLIS